MAFWCTFLQHQYYLINLQNYISLALLSSNNAVQFIQSPVGCYTTVCVCLFLPFKLKAFNLPIILNFKYFTLIPI